MPPGTPTLALRLLICILPLTTKKLAVCSIWLSEFAAKSLALCDRRARALRNTSDSAPRFYSVINFCKAASTSDCDRPIAFRSAT